MKDEDSDVRGSVPKALGHLEAKEYADEIGKLINDLSECTIWNDATKDWRETSISAEAERVLKEWGVDVEKLREKK